MDQGENVCAFIFVCCDQIYQQCDAFILCLSCACLLYRMRCADIQADRDPEGQWISAAAVFDGSVTGKVALVRKKEKK